MGQTMSEKIFSAKLGRKVSAGEYVTAKIDLAMVHEALSTSGEVLVKAGIDRVWDAEKVVVILDHYIPAPSEQMAVVHDQVRKLVERFKIARFHDGRDGICHQVMIESGYLRPGDLVVGADSHTCTYGALGVASTGIGRTEMSYVLATGELWFKVPTTVRVVMKGSLPPRVYVKDVSLAIAGRLGTEFAQYRAIEFAGELAKNLSISSRVVLSNMSVEFGAKFGLFEADDKTLSYLKSTGVEGAERLSADPDALYEQEHVIDAADLEPLLAAPHSVDHVSPVREAKGRPIQQAMLGSCTNGRIEDIRAAAEILRGKKAAPSVRLLVYPASRKVLNESLHDGSMQTLLDAGAILCAPSCGPCFGGYGGVLAPGETCISSTNRNFQGRMGSPEANVYLASPATVAASAWKGAIWDPREVD